MARLPQPGSDDGTWGDILNDYLEVEHDSGGNLKIRTDGTLAAKANDNAVVHLAGTETVTGTKNFTGTLQHSGNAIVDTTDSRLTDTRTPTDGSVTATKVATSLKPSGSAATTDEALRALGVAAGTAAAGNDSRLSDARTPTTHHVSHSPGGTDAIDYTLVNLSGLLASRPAAAAANAGLFYYATNDNGGTLYRSDGATWTRIAAPTTELGYAEITANPPDSSSNTPADVTGLSITITAPGGPIEIMAYSEGLKNNAAGGGVAIYIVEDGTIVQTGFGQVAGASETLGPFTVVSRRQPSAGSHTYKVQFGRLFGTGTATLNATATAPTFIRAVSR
jgi:hypothetical protein